MIKRIEKISENVLMLSNLNIFLYIDKILI